MTSSRSHALVGVALGLALGVLMGLSVASTVATVVSTAIAGIVVALGLVSQPQVGEGERRLRIPQVNPIRISMFSLTLVVACTSALYVRAHNIFSPTIAGRYDEWRRIEVGQELAQRLVIYEQLKVAPEGWTHTPGPPATARDSVVFSDLVSMCAELNPSTFQTSTGSVDYERLSAAFGNAGPPWSEASRYVADEFTTAAERVAALRGFWFSICHRRKE